MQYGYQFLAEYYTDTRKKWVSRYYRPANESHENAEDIVQEAFEKAMKFIEDYDPDKSDFPTWFQYIIDCTFKDYMAKERRQGLGFNNKSEYDEEEHATLDFMDDSDYDIINRLSALLLLYVGDVQVVCYLYYWKGYNIREVVRYTGIHNFTVKNYVKKFKGEAQRRYGKLISEETTWTISLNASMSVEQMED